MVGAMKRIALLTLVAAITLAAPAQAAFSPDRQVAEMAAIGAKFWSDRGLTHCAAGFQWEWDENFEPGAYAEAVVGDGGTGDGIYDCQGWLEPGAFNWQTRDWQTLATRCMIVVHEMGHGEGLTHDDAARAGYAVMADGALAPDPPRACRVWAKAEAAVVPRPRRAHSTNVTQRRGLLR